MGGSVPLTQKVSQRGIPPVGGFKVWVFFKVRRLRFSSLAVRALPQRFQYKLRSILIINNPQNSL